MKLAVFGRHFYRGVDKYWNIMDSLLVVTAIYEEVSKLVSDQSGAQDLSFLRLVRILKMVKMFRVFRLLRFFREVRTMLITLRGSISALFWACMMLGIIQCTLALVFLQGLSTYLRETPPDEIDSFTIESIATRWNSISEATLTLYKATSGGNDWAELSESIREASSSSYYLLYILFLLYIAFFMIAIMNVLTGMFVDAASKVTEKDNEDMIDIIIEDSHSDGTIGRFKEFVDGKMGERGASGRREVSWSVIHEHRRSAPVKELFRSLKVDYEEAHSIFKVLQMETAGDPEQVGNDEDAVDVEEFIHLCESKLKNSSMVLATMEYETMQLHKKVRRLMAIVEAEVSASNVVVTPCASTACL